MSNGVQVVCNDVVLATWKDNIDVNVSLFDYTSVGAAFGKQTRILVGRWTFYKSDDSMRGLDLKSGEVFKIVINDNLSTLDIFRACIQGVLL